MNVIDIIQEWLQANGSDGLYNPSEGCACSLSRSASPSGLSPGDCLEERCRPGNWTTEMPQGWDDEPLDRYMVEFKP